MAEILIVDDEINILRSLENFLEFFGHRIYTASTLPEGKKMVNARQFDAAIIDVFLQGDDGVELLDEIKSANRSTVVIVISGHSSLKIAVDAIKRGAYDFLEKPVDTEKLKVSLENGLRQKKLAGQLENMKKQWLRDNFIIGSTKEMAELVGLAEKAGPTDLSVLIQGPNGSGKELISYYVYLNSNKTDTPFITVNCAAVQPELFESTLFGHKKGSFTGAIADHAGYFKSADGGTLFLDEIGEIPLFLQVKLLRAIEYGEIQGIGYDKPVNVNTRIICATNRDLEAEVAAGNFREDLFFRLNQVPLKLPPLSKRREDIPVFIEKFKHDLEEKNGLPGKEWKKEAIDYLVSREYRGNIRELKNLVDRITLLSSGNTINTADIRKLDTVMSEKKQDEEIFSTTLPFCEMKKQLEKKYIERQLEKHDLSIQETAKALGMLANNLSRKISELGIDIHRE